MRRAAAALAAGAAVFAACPIPVAAAEPACAHPSGVYSGPVPWGQRLVDPARIWPLTKGTGQTVAVIGTGVDGRNAQFDASRLTGADGDCDGRGTIAAGIIAAQPNPRTTFTGIAPDARVLAIPYDQGSGSGGDSPDALAGAIDAASAAHAGVILVAVPAASNSPALTTAVASARSRGAVIVSAAAGTQAGASSYPTASPGVLAVGSVNQAGEPAQQEAGAYLGLSAPGADLVSTSAGASGTPAHRWPVTDPSLAAAYVAGTAALARAYHPELTPDQVVTRLTLTANRPPSGTHDPRRGWGLLDAYAAVSAVIPPGAPGPGVPAAAPRPGSVVPAAAAQPPATDRLAGVLALSGVGAAAAAGIAVAAIRRGRARGWRPGFRERSGRFSPPV
ncbi:S8 family serine peptidase [Amycolatopsis anabasis]|uniref:S8 family serine peptidase n=1 Tax=Amycolatopsis anabasis TaxID=1840409 RepID=UPI00131E03AB|nr:S8 family serine peptidase [Amycolatopsis anabasis]